jgi:hypothetical protein
LCGRGCARHSALRGAQALHRQARFRSHALTRVLEGELGGALTDAAPRGATPPLRNVGCSELFYWSINLGYRIDDHWDVMATEQHASQAGLCGDHLNQGVNYDGIRIGYRF